MDFQINKLKYKKLCMFKLVFCTGIIEFKMNIFQVEIIVRQKEELTMVVALDFSISS